MILNFVNLVQQIRSDRVFRVDKKGPIVVYAGTNWVLDGHHRAAIFCALYGPEYLIPVSEANDPKIKLPDDINLSCNICFIEGHT